MEIRDLSDEPSAAERAFRHPPFADFLRQSTFEHAGYIGAVWTDEEQRRAVALAYREDPDVVRRDMESTAEILVHADGLAWSKIEVFLDTPVLVFLTPFSDGTVVETVNRRAQPPRMNGAARVMFWLIPQPLWTAFHAPGWGYHLLLLDTVDPDVLWQSHLRQVRAREAKGGTIDKTRGMARFMELRTHRADLAGAFMSTLVLASLGSLLAVASVAFSLTVSLEGIWTFAGLAALAAAWLAGRQLLIPLVGRLPLRRWAVREPDASP